MLLISCQERQWWLGSRSPRDLINDADMFTATIFLDSQVLPFSFSGWLHAHPRCRRRRRRRLVPVSAMTSSPRLEGDPDPGPPPSAIERLQLRREELETHADAVDDLVHELADDADTLRSQEGWDAVTAAGAAEWASDRGNVFRALRVSSV